MADDVPGAAYIFARTLHNSRELIEDPSISIPRKLAVIDNEIAASLPINNADAGIGILALRFLRILISSLERGDIGSLALSAAFGDIAPRGKRYRDLDERDFQPPVNEDVRRILQNGSHKCIADLVQTVRTQSTSTASADDDVWNLVAMFDLREEGASGRLAPLINALEDSLK